MDERPVEELIGLPEIKCPICGGTVAAYGGDNLDPEAGIGCNECGAQWNSDGVGSRGPDE